jgi:phospholipid/cholesterol/gamma-HCH transport system substrate-binding protein
MHRRGISPLRAGLAGAVVLVAITYVIFGGRLPFQHDYLIKAVVSEASELGDRSPVRIAGVDVGHVSDVKRGPGTTAVVTMAIDRTALPIHTDATLKIRPRLFLEGNFFLELSPGTPSAPRLAEGGTIPLSQTAVPVQLDQVLTSLQSASRQDLQQLVHAFATTLEDGGAQALNRSIPPMEPAFLRGAVTAQALQGERAGDLAGAIRDTDSVVHAIDSRAAQLPSLVTSLDRTMTTVADHATAVQASLSGLDELTRQAPPAFDALNNLFPTARRFLIELRPGLTVAPATLGLGNPLLDQAGRLISPPELPALLAQLDPALKPLRRLEPQLGSLLGKLRQATECVRVNALPLLRKPVDDPPLSTGQPVYRDFMSAVVGQTSSTQNFDGDGLAVRYHAGFGDQMVTTGTVPGVDGPLVGLTSSPILGSRPAYTPGYIPPFHPDVPCVSQKLQNLTADTGPPPPQRTLP